MGRTALEAESPDHATISDGAIRRSCLAGLARLSRSASQGGVINIALIGAIEPVADIIDFYLSPTRNTKAAKRFLGKALKGLKDWEMPAKINTDKPAAYGAAIAELKKAGKLPDETQHHQVKYLNNVVEADHGKLKQLIRPVRGFKSLKTAYATIKGFEVMHALRKGQARAFCLQPGNRGEGRLVERAFGLSLSALAEAAQIVADHYQMVA